MADNKKKYTKEELDEMENSLKEKYHYDEMSDEKKAVFDKKINETREEYQVDDNTDDDKKDDAPYKEELQRERKKENKPEEDEHEKEDDDERFL